MFYEIRRYQAVPGRRAEWVRYMEDVVIPYQQSHGMTVTASFVDTGTDYCQWRKLVSSVS